MKRANEMCVVYSETLVTQHLDNTEYFYNVTRPFIKDCIYKRGYKHVKNLTDNDF